MTRSLRSIGISLAVVAACSVTGVALADADPAASPSASSAPSPDLRPELIEGLLEQDHRLQFGEVEGQPAVFSSGNEAGEIDLPATERYIVDVIQHADIVWTNWFLQNGFAEPWVGYEIIAPDEMYFSSCNLGGVKVFGSAFPNAFYCSFDDNGTDKGMIVFPVETMAKMWSGNIFEQQVSDVKRVGDFAAAMMVAHEFGHHIQDELTEQSGIAAPAQPNSELIADCLSGIWAYSVALDRYLEEGDLEEAINALEVIGDNRGSHGTGAERQNAYLIGYSGSVDNPLGGTPANCIRAFWPAASSLTG
jgi:hypothetical protein